MKSSRFDRNDGRHLHNGACFICIKCVCCFIRLLSHNLNDWLVFLLLHLMEMVLGGKIQLLVIWSSFQSLTEKCFFVSRAALGIWQLHGMRLQVLLLLWTHHLKAFLFHPPYLITLHLVKPRSKLYPMV